MANAMQTSIDTFKPFFSAYLEFAKDQSSSKTERAIDLGQRLLQALPTTSPLYSLSSCLLARCLFVTWKETRAEEKRDLELLRIIGSRVNPAVRHCRPNEPYRALCEKTQQQYCCIMRQLSALLENDFWDHEHLSNLNTAIAYAQQAWQVLRNDPAEEFSTAENLGNLYMTRYMYLGRPGDLDDALKFSTMEVILSTGKASEAQFRAYAKQGVRVSLWSLFEDQPDNMDDSVQYMNEVIQRRTWKTENQGVDHSSGSSYSVALGMYSRICCRAFIRRQGHYSGMEKFLKMAASHSKNACKGTLQIDPGRILTLDDSARAHLQLYLASSSLPILHEAIQYTISALDVIYSLLPHGAISRRYNGVRMTGHGGSISSLVMTDNRVSSHTAASLKERRFQRWIISVLEVSADLLLARYQKDLNPQDLAHATLGLKLIIQGMHAWGPARSRMLFKLNQALHEQLRQAQCLGPRRVESYLSRASKAQSSWQTMQKLCVGDSINRIIKHGVFAPLVRNQCTATVVDLEPVEVSSWLPIISRGAYDHDMQLSTDLPNILTSDILLSSEHIQLLQTRLDPQIDSLFNKLNSDDPETSIIRTMWDRLYCVASASLKRAELYQRALTIFLKHGDLESARELAELAEPVLGHLELFLMEPALYLSDMAYASNLATTMACIWLQQGLPPWKAISAIEKGRELASRDGMNTVRSYGFESGNELLPRVRTIREQLQTPKVHDQLKDIPVRHRFEQRSKNFATLLTEIAHNEACLMPFGKSRCMLEAHNGCIIHLITSKVGTYALVTTSDDMCSLQLTRCTYDKLSFYAAALRKAVAACQEQENERGTANKTIRSILEWLWKTVVRPIIRFLRLIKSDEYSMTIPRIRWIACGVFSQLPIHAAGLYTSKPNDYLDQYAVSSYLSSIRTHVAAQNRKPLVPYYQNANREFTLFGMSTSPAVPEGHLADLDVDSEKQRIFASLGSTFTNNALNNCNLGAARNMMHRARLVHFSCHGLSHPSDSTLSRLVLLRDDAEPCTVAAIRDMDIPNALLLFLSACHSASDASSALSDEITHVAKAFLLAGFPTVIGTLWQAYQASAMDIAAEFYALVAKGWRVDQEEPAADLFPRALHWALWKWREKGNMWKPVDWASWVCFQ